MTSEYVPPESLVTDNSDLVLELSTSDEEKRHFYFKDFLCEFYIFIIVFSFLETFHEFFVLSSLFLIYSGLGFWGCGF